MAEGNQGRTLERALDVIESVSSSTDPLTLTQISKATGLHIATTKRILGTLEKRDYLKMSPTGYTLGPQVLPHAHAFQLQDRLALISPPILREVASISSLTSSVFVPSGDQRVLISRIEAPNALGYEFPIGQLLSLTLGGGKVLLAFMDQEKRDEIVNNYEPFHLADGEIQTAETLRQDLANIHETDYFVSSSERSRGTVSLTAPIRNGHDEVIATISIAGHDGLINESAILEHQSLVLQAARRISTQML
ncbi:IclR family transcriptional regulator [Corynebacterium suranareeae]|uniref:IclR family transcriptional regulator n=1 Tax=Corynebacterium suranareeae TaxID=2506452 RepID=A0A160PPM3_9CORY|nr:IclR family transcriptional regulator [Corynebacterium suranareeae]BAU95335.1 IclR family transcriptional regulator [Corynebacterium suranareeae]